MLKPWNKLPTEVAEANDDFKTGLNPVVLYCFKIVFLNKTNVWKILENSFECLSKRNLNPVWIDSVVLYCFKIVLVKHF